MTVTRDPNLLAALVEGQTYQVSTSDGPDGVRWHMARYGRAGDELARLLDHPDAPAGVRAAGADLLVWLPVADRATEPLPDGDYRASALAWLGEATGRDPETVDCVLILPDGVERTGR